jgi:hypothetical protein
MPTDSPIPGITQDSHSSPQDSLTSGLPAEPLIALVWKGSPCESHPDIKREEWWGGRSVSHSLPLPHVTMKLGRNSSYDMGFPMARSMGISS